MKLKIEDLENQIQILQNEESNSKARRDEALCYEKMTNEQIEAFSNLMAQLKIYELDFAIDIPKFVQLVDHIKGLGFDVNKILSLYQDSVLLEIKHQILSHQTKEMRDEKRNLEQSISVIQGMERFHAQRLYVYSDLESMGLGLNELRLLFDAIRELAAENNMTYDMAVRQFFKSKS